MAVREFDDGSQTLLAWSMCVLPALALGAKGIAGNFPLDHNIENGPQIVFVEMFDVPAVSRFVQRQAVGVGCSSAPLEWLRTQSGF